MCLSTQISQEDYWGQPGLVAYDLNASTGEAEAGRSLLVYGISSRPAWAYTEKPCLLVHTRKAQGQGRRGQLSCPVLPCLSAFQANL